MTSNRWEKSGKKWSNIRWKWMVTGRGREGDPQKLDVWSYNWYKSYWSPDSVPERCLALL